MKHDARPSAPDKKLHSGTLWHRNKSRVSTAELKRVLSLGVLVKSKGQKRLAVSHQNPGIHSARHKNIPELILQQPLDLVEGAKTTMR